MDQKPSFLWSLAVAAAFPVLLALIFLIGGQIGETQPVDYVWFFIGGALIGLAVVYFLRRSETERIFQTVMIASAVGVPFALFGMNFGRVIGPIGVLFLGVSPGIFLPLAAYYVSKWLIKK